MDNDQFDELLKFDPIAAAEKVDFGQLGMGVSILLAQSKEAAIAKEATARFDTTMSNNLVYYQSVITDMGFEQVLVVPFEAKSYGSEDVQKEQQFFYAHRDGMLLIFDTWMGTEVNSGRVYYAWKQQTKTGPYGRYTSSGGFHSASQGDWDDGLPEDAVWFGDHDCRQAIRHNLDRLRENGQFLAKWPEYIKRPSVWALHWGDLRDDTGNPLRNDQYTQARTNARNRFQLLPVWVQEMIGVDRLWT